MPYFALDGANNKIETLSKEEILTAIENAQIGRSITEYDMAVISRLREINHNDELRFWIGTQAEYNAIAAKENNVLYIISDDNSKEEIIEYIESLQNATDALSELLNQAIETEAEDIENERLLRSGADASLDAKIERTKSDFLTNLSNETAQREAAVAAEKTARQNADTTLQSQINTAQGDISSLQTRVSTAEGNISSLQTDVSAIQSNLGQSTLLYDDEAGVGDYITLSEDFRHFKELFFVDSNYGSDTVIVGNEARNHMTGQTSRSVFIDGLVGLCLKSVDAFSGSTDMFLDFNCLRVQVNSGTSLLVRSGTRMQIAGGTVSEVTAKKIWKIYGLQRIAPNE